MGGKPDNILDRKPTKETKKETTKGSKKETTKGSKKETPKEPNGKAKNNEEISRKWNNISLNLVENTLINIYPKKQQGKEKDKENKGKEKVKDNIKKLNDKQKKMLDDLNNTMKKGLSNLNDAQKKSLDNIAKMIQDKLSPEEKNDDFLKELLMVLLAQKDSQKVNVSTIERESYL